MWEPASLLLDLLRPQDGGDAPAPTTFEELFDQLETGAEDALPAAENTGEGAGEGHQSEVGDPQREGRELGGSGSAREE